MVIVVVGWVRFVGLWVHEVLLPLPCWVRLGHWVGYLGWNLVNMVKGVSGPAGAVGGCNCQCWVIGKVGQGYVCWVHKNVVVVCFQPLYG